VAGYEGSGAPFSTQQDTKTIENLKGLVQTEL